MYTFEEDPVDWVYLYMCKNMYSEFHKKKSEMNNSEKKGGIRREGEREKKGIKLRYVRL